MLLLAVVLSSTTLLNSGTIEGRLVDPDSKPVRAADVLLVCGSEVDARAETDADGRFQIDAPPSGAVQCDLTFAREGLSARPIAVDATSTAGSHDVGTVRMDVSAVSESIVVSAAQVDVPLSHASSAVTIITGDELRARQIATVADALREVPGLSVNQSGTMGAITSVFPRGGESDYSLVLVDGIEANAFGGGFDFAHLPADDIDRIEIVRGPQSAIYGSNAIGAVINVVTREGGPIRGDASMELEPSRVTHSVPSQGASFEASRVTGSTSGSRGPWFWGAGAERVGSAGLDSARAADGEVVDNDDYTRSEAGGSGGWHGPNGSALRGEARFERDERGNPGPFGTNPIGAFTGIDLVSRERDDRWLGSIRGTLPAIGLWRTTAQVTWDSISSDFTSPFGPSSSTSTRWTARAESDAHLGKGLDVSGGAEVQGERATSTFVTNDAFDEIPVTRAIVGVFGEGRWQRAERLFVTSGVRLEDIRRGALAGFSDPTSPRPPFATNTVVSINPRGGVAWFARPDAGSSTRLRAAAGTGIRPPDAFEIAFTDNPGLKPERSRSVEAGVDQELARGHAVVDATAFNNSFDDLIVATGPFTGLSRFRTDNISNARARGVEIGGTLREKAAGFDVDTRVTYTFLSSAILSVNGGAGAPPPFMVGDPLLRRPRDQWSIDVTATRNRATAWLRGGGRSRTLDVEPTLGTFGGLFYAPGYDVWNAGASWSGLAGIELFGRVENLADRQYEEALGFPETGRRVVIGIRAAASRPKRSAPSTTTK